MKAPVISVMIPCFNSANTLPRALKSLLNQTYPHWEALIIDDGSTDRLDEVFFAYKDSRIKVIRHTTNKGRASARQTALENMTGDFLTMLDSDDWILPTKFEKQVEVLKANPDIALVSTSIFFESKDRKLVGVVRFSDGALSVKPKLSSPRPLPIAHAPIMVRKEVVSGCQYDPSLKFSEDLDFFLPILMKNPYATLQEPLYVYTFEDNRSSSKFRAQMKAHIYIFSKYLNGYFISASKRIFLSFTKIFISFFIPKNAKYFSLRGVAAASATEEKNYQDAVLTLV